MNRCTAKVSIGETRARFLVRKPRFSTVSKMHESSIALPVNLSWNSPTIRTLNPGIYVSTIIPRPLQPFTLRTFTRPGEEDPTSRLDRFVARLHQRTSDMKPLFPLHGAVPVLDWYGFTSTGIVDGHWRLKVSLPPQTEFYSTNPDIWNLLGFDNTQITSELRAVGQDGVQKRVYGFLVDGADYQGYREIVSRFPRLKSRSLGNELATGLKEYDDFDENLAAEMHFFVEFRDLADIYIMGQRIPDGNVENVVIGLTAVIHYLRRLLDLNVVPLEVGQDRDGESFTLTTSGGQPDANFALSLRFGPELRELFNAGAGGYAFAFEDAPRTYVFTCKNSRRDPFEGLYPIYMSLVGHGEAENHFDSLGYVPIAGFIADGKQPQTILSNGIPIGPDMTVLNVEFYDYKNELFVFNRPMEFHLLLRFPREQTMQKRK